VAAVVATFVAWQGVALVGDQVTDRPPTPVAADGVDDGSTATTSTTAPPPGPATTTTTVAPTGPPGPASTPPSGPGPTQPTTTIPPAPPPPAGTTRTYNLVGGDVALRFEASGVTVLYATPRAGFTVEVGNSHGTGRSVRFDGDDHRSEVVGWWEGGPVDEVREDD
jgi:hypothetical protein